MGSTAPRLQEEGRAISDRPALALGHGAVSHNLNGQKLGRKGRVTRERILAAAVELLEADDGEAISLSAVARRASLGMSSIYNYFSDLTELLLAVLEPVIATADEAYLGMVQEYWPDAVLADCCLDFVTAYTNFWARHSRLLHLRNAMSDAGDERMMEHRIACTQPIIRALVLQMDGQPERNASAAVSMATMTMIGIDRSITIATDRRLPKMLRWMEPADDDRFIAPGARLMELAIRDTRDHARG